MKEKENIENIENEKTKEKNKIFKIALMMILILLIGIGIGSCSCGKKNNDHIKIPMEKEPVPELDSSAGEYVKPEQQNPNGGVAIPGWGTLTIPANKTTNIKVDLFNPEANVDLYYLTFEIRLPNDSAEGYETLYKSGLVEPGLHIQEIALTRPLDAGEYDAIIHVQPYRISDKSTTNNADLKTKLIVR